jgi:hypothetical protein
MVTREDRVLLPIGSIVMLKGAQVPLMVYGRIQRNLDDDSMWDYLGVIHPEGFIDAQRTYLFDDSQIETLLFIGFQSPKELLMNDHLRRFRLGEEVGEWPPENIEELLKQE